ncbi:ribosomal protein L11 methyltransferase, putative [Parvularcula bermudensis HTCC2503]|uniref:Ribosomal protein L11 methyltransferase n=1 Tax=Parvularcula bermudensis (strain ATCC BAA-594 / HTCC2503 / KCTC 12087) TaxID=314260 RepID=E0TDX2_PARBH|nr:50S ribosomal protein L11 methyltransferase [Parvularcula bermudensis]ADM10421.1 ribosomal protein L11 methyltransferase, putative [Parvularcula bermudensis HTCC2503]
MSDTVVLTWSGSETALQSLEQGLTHILYPPAEAVSLTKDDPTSDDAESGWRLEAYFALPPDLDQIAALTAPLPLDPWEEELLEDRDWVSHALEGLGIVKAGAFVLFGRHDADKVNAEDGLPLQIEANRAFGTGHHPTTAGCLEALTALAKGEPRRLLDLGTGSGVLAIAARRLFPEARIVATDIDAPSVAIAAENAALNKAPGIVFLEATGVPQEVAEEGPFDIILANILAEPLISLAPALAAALAPTGQIVLAGLLDRQEDGVTAAYGREGLTLKGRFDGGTPTWPTLLLSARSGG